jgi:hypothetical protein
LDELGSIGFGSFCQIAYRISIQLGAELDAFFKKLSAPIEK